MSATDKTLKALGKDTVDEMDTMREDDLKLVITDAQNAMRTAKAELEANQEYRKAKADVSLLSSGKREVDKRQKCKTAYALDRLEELGKLDITARYDWEKLRLTAIRELTARRERRAQDEAAQAAGNVRRYSPEGVWMETVDHDGNTVERNPDYADPTDDDHGLSEADLEGDADETNLDESSTDTAESES